MDGVGLLCDAKAAGLTVRAEGDRLKIQGPQEAEPLALRLLEHKRDVMKALQMLEEPTPPSWDQETKVLIDWFTETGQHLIPLDPFQLTKWIRITMPSRFREALLFEISMGPDGLRSRIGALQSDLRLLKEKLPSLSKGDEG